MQPIGHRLDFLTELFVGSVIFNHESSADSESDKRDNPPFRLLQSGSREVSILYQSNPWKILSSRIDSSYIRLIYFSGGVSGGRFTPDGASD